MNANRPIFLFKTCNNLVSVINTKIEPFPKIKRFLYLMNLKYEQV